MKRVFIIPEPHIWDKNFKNRVDYVGEVYGCLAEVISRIISLDGEKIIIFAGDVFHRAFSSVRGITKVLNLFVELNDITDYNVYSVVGNHELSYATYNPFWMMAEDYTNRFENKHYSDSFGIFRPGIKIKDSLCIGPLEFVFGHYDRTDYEVDLNSSRDIVLISHNSLMEKDIDQVVTDQLKRDTKTEYIRTTQLRSSSAIPLTRRLKYVFVGHMHTMYSDFLVDEVIDGVLMKFYLRYMGSIGRTAINEINDNDLARTVPQFVIQDNDSYTYEPFSVNLKPYSEVVKTNVVEENAVKATMTRALKTLSETVAFGDTPENCIRRELSEYPVFLTLFEEIYRNYTPSEVEALLQEARGL